MAIKKVKKTKEKYYALDNILKKEADYYVIIGERSNGKTYSSLKHALEKYFKDGSCFAYIRRWDVDIMGAKGEGVLSALVSNDEIAKMSKGEWNSVTYYSRRWYLRHVDPKGHVDNTSEEPIGYAFAISQQEHYKSSSYPSIKTIIFDEFLTQSEYLPDEFVLFQNLLSTIIRDRDGIEIFMLGNTINTYAPYFVEMGLKNIKKMKQDQIDVYEYGTSGLKVAVEFSSIPMKKKQSDKYFAFNNPKLNMIRGDGSVWQLDIFPHCPTKYLPKDIRYIYFINFDNEIFQAEIIRKDKISFTFIHRKTTPIKEDNENLVYQLEYSIKRNYRRNITKAFSPLEKTILSYFAKDKVYYQDNEVGMAVQNYLNECRNIR